MPSQSRRKRRANQSHLRREKVTRPALRRYVRRVVVLRPLAIGIAVVALALGIASGRPLLAVVAAVFGALFAGVLWTTTPRRCPVCRTSLEGEPDGIWVGMPKTAGCPRCRVSF